jgi:hypothetical protein
MNDDSPKAVVREIDGKLVLDDPNALAIVRAVEKHNCKGLFDMNQERVAHFKRRMAEKNLSASEVVIVLINVDDVHGRDLAEVLMPGADWQAIRDRGEMPVARGLVSRKPIEEILSTFDVEAAEKLAASTKVAVVVVDRGVAEIFT